MPHASLRSFVSTLLVALLTLRLAAQAPTATGTDFGSDGRSVRRARREGAAAPGTRRHAHRRAEARRLAGPRTPSSCSRRGATTRPRAPNARRPPAVPRRRAAALRHAMAANGTRYRVDERGATRVPRHGYVLAFEGELAVRRFVAENARRARLLLTLAPPHLVTVEVVTTDGKPAAAVPIALRDTERHTPIRWARAVPTAPRRSGC
jgi:hypothetical protein